jgi:hypothetical protein
MIKNPSKKLVPRKRQRRSARPSRDLTVAPAIAIAVEHPAWAMLRETHAMMSAMAAKIDTLEAKVDAAAVVLPSTMVNAAKMLTIIQAGRGISDMDDGRLYNRPHLIHRVAGTCYVDNDEIRAAFPNEHNQARFLEIVERNKPRAGHKAYVEKAQEVQADEPEPPLLSHILGNDKAG